MPYALENDCEEQGYTSLLEGCTICRLDEVDQEGWRKSPQLVARNGYWRCPICNGSYGEVEDVYKNSKTNT